MKKLVSGNAGDLADGPAARPKRVDGRRVAMFHSTAATTIGVGEVVDEGVLAKRNLAEEGRFAANDLLDHRNEFGFIVVTVSAIDRDSERNIINDECVEIQPSDIDWTINQLIV